MADEALSCGEWQGQGGDVYICKGHLGCRVGDVVASDARVGGHPLQGDRPPFRGQAEEGPLYGVYQ